MKTLIFTLALLFMTVAPLAAQPNFSKIYLTEDRAFSSGNTIHAVGNDYLLGIHTQTFQPDVIVNPKFIIVNEQGEETWSHEIQDLGFTAFLIEDNVLIEDDRYVYAQIFCKQPGVPNFSGLLSFDLETQLYDSVFFNAEVNLGMYSLIEGEGDSLLLYMDVVNDEELPGWINSITYYDRATGISNRVSYAGDLYNTQPGEIRRLPDGNILMAFHAWDETSPNRTYPKFGILRKISSRGEILWTRKFSNEELHNHIPTVLPLENGDIAYGWTKDSFSLSRPPRQYDRSPVAVYFLDSTGEIKDYTMLGPEDADLNTMKLLRNGDILGMGRSFQRFGQDGGDIAWAFRLAPNGDVLWKRKIYLANQQRFRYDLTDAIEAENGDLLFTGTCPVGERSSAAWLLKLSADGCYDPADCDSTIIRITEEVVSTRPRALPVRAMKISPNPATDQITVELAGITGFDRRPLELLDAFGRLVAAYELTGNATTIEVGNVAAGVYHLTTRIDGIAFRGKVVIVD